MVQELISNLLKEEQFFLDWAMKCQTWEEVEECATAIYEWSKENETRTEDDEKLVPQMFDIGDDEEDEDGDESEEFVMIMNQSLLILMMKIQKTIFQN